MKKRINLWLIMFLAISLALPIYSIAADMNMTLMTEDGFRVTTNTPTIKSFAVDNDNNLVVILKDPPILDFGNPHPEITIDTPSSTCTIVNNAYVKGNPGTTISFTVRTTTAGATLSSTSDTTHPSIVPDYYGASFNAQTGIFSWNTAGNPSTPAGRYLAVFSATPSTCPLPSPSTCTSQLVVMINIALQYKLTLTAGANGSVSPVGVTYYDPGTQVQISATANPGYYFSGWSDGGTGNPRTVTMDQDRTINATFTKTPTYTVSVTNLNQAGGSVSPASQTNIPSGGSATFSVTINANYNPLVSAGTLSGTTGTVNWTFTNVTSNIDATINFTQISTYRVTANNQNPAGGSVSPAYVDVLSGGQAVFQVVINANYTASVSEGSLSGTTGTVNWTISNVTSTHTATINFQPVTPSGETWVWDKYPMFFLNPGEEKVYIVNINKPLTYLKMSISGLTMNTMGTFSWTFPDGRILPQNSKQGLVDIVSMNGAGVLALRAGNNIPDNPIPQGNHVLRVSASVPSSYFKISIEAE